jgi:hypothetical protein
MEGGCHRCLHHGFVVSFGMTCSRITGGCSASETPVIDPGSNIRTNRNSVFKALVLSNDGWLLFPLLAFQQLTGISVIVTNLGDLFEDASVSIPSGYVSSISGSAQVAACLCAGVLVETFGRKTVWVISFR